MSWFDKIKDVAKSAALSAAGPASIAGAVPINHNSFWSSLSNAVSSSNEVVNVTDDESASENEATSSQYTAQVTTRARFTYQLDRYRKNALLLFVQIKNNLSTQGSRIEETTTQDINALLETFSAFRFEVNTHIDLTCGEIENVCREFFQQDFEDYGAIVVVVLTFEGTAGALSASDGRFSESIIFRHLTDDLNPTLVNKPRVYITEANRAASSEGPSTFSLPLEDHRDVLVLHVPTIDHGAMLHRPLKLFCKNINDMANSNDFVTIMEKSIEELHTEAPCAFENRAIELNHSFTKEMILARA